MNDTYTPRQFLTVSKSGDRIDWPATGRKVTDWVFERDASPSSAAMQSTEIIFGLRKLVKKHGVQFVIAALAMDKEQR